MTWGDPIMVAVSTSYACGVFGGLLWLIHGRDRPIRRREQQSWLKRNLYYRLKRGMTERQFIAAYWEKEER